MEAKRLYIPAYVRNYSNGFTEDQNEFDFIITTDKRDSYGTIFTADGWDFTRYNENPVVFYQHRSNDDDPDNLIGITVKGPWRETLSDGTIAHIARVRFETPEVNEKAEKIRKKIIAGTLRMASIGANVQEYRWGDTSKEENGDDIYFTKKELFEWSVVNLGSNPGAMAKRNDEVLTAIRSEKDPEDTSEQPTHEKNGLSLERARLEIYKSKKF
ncbi:hypothetical protein HX109_15425 [Galbibacter sp. BG1]|uniref:hypothetical protein n=1 Tax=Galbibacter sp. BG1 TaxID=1170699 RepID=UPI0015C1B214|nr:hypothetical protein [Galbibacter sp. BG1]QLE02890.1 hypothetical protein HX109_15425 [Galbibacter sp. BG1]